MSNYVICKWNPAGQAENTERARSHEVTGPRCIAEMRERRVYVRVQVLVVVLV